MAASASMLSRVSGVGNSTTATCSKSPQMNSWQKDMEVHNHAQLGFIHPLIFSYKTSHGNWGNTLMGRCQLSIWNIMNLNQLHKPCTLSLSQPPTASLESMMYLRHPPSSFLKTSSSKRPVRRDETRGAAALYCCWIPPCYYTKKQVQQLPAVPSVNQCIYDWSHNQKACQAAIL
jgi:hypothetical protein